MKHGKRWFLNGIRILTLSVCVLAVFVSITRAQVRPPGGVGGGVRPPSGMVGGGPTIPNPPPFQPPIIKPPIMQPPIMQPPIAQPPIMQPPMPNPGMGGNFGGGGLVKTWTCGRCGRNLGTGDFPPAQCPGCQARIINGIGGPQNMGNPNPPGMPPPNFNPPINNPVVMPPVNNPNFNTPPAGPVTERAAPPPLAVDETTRSGAMTVGMVILICALLGVLVLGVCVVGGVVLVMTMNKSPKKASRGSLKPRRSRA